jgi:hypothetical protein
MQITDEMRAAILADPMSSNRVLAKKLGCSPSGVRKVRASTGATVRAQSEAQVTARCVSWVERAELLAEDVEKMLQMAANDPESRKDPKLIHAICGGVKIVFDALGDWRMTQNAGGNAAPATEESKISENPAATTGTNIIPIRSQG